MAPFSRRLRHNVYYSEFGLAKDLAKIGEYSLKPV
jgi:hypothetical protein